MTPEERADIRQAVAYHREYGGYSEHNGGGRSCRCAACRLVRTVEYLGEVQDALDAMWAEVDSAGVANLRRERPEAVDTAIRNHGELHHGE